MAVPWDAHSKPFSGQCEKERSDVDIRMEGLLVSCRSNDALLAWPTRQGKDQKRGGRTNYLIKFSFFLSQAAVKAVFDRRVHAPLQLRSCANQLTVKQRRKSFDHRVGSLCKGFRLMSTKKGKRLMLLPIAGNETTTSGTKPRLKDKDHRHVVVNHTEIKQGTSQAWNGNWEARDSHQKRLNSREDLYCTWKNRVSLKIEELSVKRSGKEKNRKSRCGVEVFDVVHIFMRRIEWIVSTRKV